MSAMRTFFSAHASACLIAATIVTFTGSSALAAEGLRGADTDVDLESSASSRAEHHLPGGLTAGTDTAKAAATTWGGYDGATHNPVASGLADLRLIPRLHLLVGFGSTSQPGAVQVRALGGAQVEILRQASNGINATLGFLYRQDRFATEEGLLEWSATLSRRFGRLVAVANLAYGQDGEGDDREGEVRVLGLYRITAQLEVGGDARVLSTLGSSDPYRVQRAEPTLELAGAPLVAYSLGRFSLLAEAGLSGQKVDRLRTGALVLGGLGAVY